MIKKTKKKNLMHIFFASCHADHMSLLLPAIYYAFTTMRTQHDSTCLTTVVKAHQLKETWRSTKPSHSSAPGTIPMCQREHPAGVSGG